MSVRALEARALGEGDRLLAGTPVLLLVLLAAAAAATGAAVTGGWLPASAWPVAGVAVAHAGMIGLAIGWGRTERRVAINTVVPGLITALLLATAEAGSLADQRLAVAFLAVPLWLMALRVAGHLDGLGLTAPDRPQALFLGAGIGALLGGHLVLSAGATLGYHVRDDGVIAYLAAVAYDVGANVPSGELLFRGALLNRLQRRWAFAPAALTTTVVWLLRYLVDPRLPASPEALVGAVMYLSVLGGANAWLFWWSGSLLPGLLSSLTFFAAYRLLALP